jgi:hypothetical protein
LVKAPPAYTRVPAGETARARTVLLALRFQGSRWYGLLALKAASRLRAVVLPLEGSRTAVKLPAT